MAIWTTRLLDGKQISINLDQVIYVAESGSRGTVVVGLPGKDFLMAGPFEAVTTAMNEAQNPPPMA